MPSLGLSDTASLLVWLGALIVAVSVLGLGILVARRRLLGPSPHSEGPASALTDLRAMRDRGEITPEEFDRARAKLVARMKASVTSTRTEGGPPKPR